MGSAARGDLAEGHAARRRPHLAPRGAPIPHATRRRRLRRIPRPVTDHDPAAGDETRSPEPVHRRADAALLARQARALVRQRHHLLALLSLHRRDGRDGHRDVPARLGPVDGARRVWVDAAVARADGVQPVAPGRAARGDAMVLRTLLGDLQGPAVSQERPRRSRGLRAESSGDRRPLPLEQLCRDAHGQPHHRRRGSAPRRRGDRSRLE